ncbi:MAG: outer membrane lipoprotein carrier protein LolA [Candidatus Cryptobacteroides sp.]
MGTFKRTTAFLALAALVSSASLPLSAAGQGLENFFTKAASSLVSFDYSFVCRTADAKLTGDGSVLLQQDCFRVKGNGLELFCDGQSLWTVDTFSEEAVIETVDSSSDALMANPALLITAAGESFTLVSSSAATFAGQAADKSVLSPKEAPESSADISALTLYFKKDSIILIGAEVKMKDGTVSTFTLKNFKYSDRLESKESFRLDEKTLASSYVVTDLR